ncbi:hypothetical protein HY416_03960 [Candidatus Kaiserbacteria bacterium]|nr:hypothetical protein [Candidatus Kaiserbacteria bacterium]
MERPPAIRFSMFEDFAIRTERKENPRTMPYVLCSVSAFSGQRERISRMLKDDMERLFRESSTQKEVVTVEPAREFLQTVWQRDSYLYFNGVYFPWRWIDTKGQNRPEREAYVLKMMGMKDSVSLEKVLPRILTDRDEGMFAMGEGGLYFPDHDNNTLFISRGIVAEEGTLSEEELTKRLTDMHKHIFGDDIDVTVLPQPDTTPHLDTHFSVIPRTKIALFENGYYGKAEGAGAMETLDQLGYESVQTPPSVLSRPLNIFYMENDAGTVCAYVYPSINESVRDLLHQNNVETYDMSPALGNILDAQEGGPRCITNEVHTKDPAFIRNLGFKAPSL